MDRRFLRSVFGRFATGVTVVTFERGGETLGMTVNSFSSVSLEPPMVLFCPALECKFSQGAEIGSLFTISVLSTEQHNVCLHFAGRPCLEDSPWAAEAKLPPVVEGSLAYMRCRLEALYPHGDHYVAVGTVLEADNQPEGEPLMFYGGKYPRLVYDS